MFDEKMNTSETDGIIIQNSEPTISKKEKILKTSITGFDELFNINGIPQGNSVLIAGGPGTGKSTFCRQICYNLVSNGKKCMYVSFEESKERIEKKKKLRKLGEILDILNKKILLIFN